MRVSSTFGNTKRQSIEKVITTKVTGLPTDGMWSQSNTKPSDEPGVLTAKTIGIRSSVEPRILKGSLFRDAYAAPSILPSSRRMANVTGEIVSFAPNVTGKLAVHAPLHAVDLTQGLLPYKGMSNYLFL